MEDDVRQSSVDRYAVSQACRWKAERDVAMQELKTMRERNIELWMESGMANELVTCAEQKAERLGKLVWRLQNRLARSHRREKQLRNGMRMWREKAIGGPVRTMSAYDLLPEADLETLRWVREQGGLAEVEKRIMPEGYEWPRYESGELVDIGDNVIGRFSADAIKVRSVELVKGKTYLREGCKTDRAVLVCTGVRVKHPPVPAGDGKPLEVGQTVWLVGDDGSVKLECEVIDVCESVGKFSVMVREVGKYGYSYVRPSSLTHTKPEPPDSWERLEEDAGKNPFDYCKDVGHRLDTCENSEVYKARDLVRRAKALAGEPKVKCVAEVKIDGERLEELAHDAAVELTGIDRDALLNLADELEEDACWEVQTPGEQSGAWRLKDACDRIREACGGEVEREADA